MKYIGLDSLFKGDTVGIGVGGIYAEISPM